MKVLFLTGAGVSANAGIPTYRDEGSSWRDKDMEKKSHSSRYGNHLDELWDGHWGPLSKQMLTAEPTKAHRVMAEFQKNNPETIIATQNIDTLHEQAGSDNVAHVHGEMTAICIRCHSTDIAEWTEGVPECLSCGKKRTRPNVVLFGEQLNAKMFKGLEFFARTATHVISVGTSLNVFPAASLMLDAIQRHGQKTIIINKEPTPFDKWASEVYHDDADLVLEDVLRSL